MTNAAYNAFSVGVARRIADRAMGLGEGGDRLVAIAPSDYVLTGFLTPARRHSPGLSEHEPDEEGLSGENLPADSPYEQSALGLAWLVPADAAKAGLEIEIRATAHVYVRRLPTLDEQTAHANWTPVHNDEDQAELVPVWTRHALPPMECRVLLQELIASKRLRISLWEAIAQRWEWTYSALLWRHPSDAGRVFVPRSKLTSELFESWLAAIPGSNPCASWRPVLDARVAVNPQRSTAHRVEIRLVNRTAPGTHRTHATSDPNLYGVRLEVIVPEHAHEPTMFNELPDDYRYDRTMPVAGVNVHAVGRREKDYWRLETETVPIRAVARLEPRTAPSAEPTFSGLQTDPIGILRRIAHAMQEYDSAVWGPLVATLHDPARRDAARDRQRFVEDELMAFERGIALLEDARYPLVAQAFKLMNRTMERLGQRARHRYDQWRLFQIVFIVRNLAALAAREHRDLLYDDAVDVLWFAAGGGKTEAFLGLILWQAFFDRLRGKHLGVTAFVRFPLRLLTFQQLQRFARALAMAELVRREEGLGGVRFSLGYFVGSDTTPNRIEDEEHERFTRHGPDEKLLRLRTCPFCNSPVRLAYQASLRLVQHVCTKADACPGGTDAIPVLICDDDLYRYLPTVIVSTVDKVALIGQQQRFANLLGRFTMYCPVHGASFGSTNRDRCEAAAHAEARPEFCGRHTVDYGPFHEPGPSLLVQDELHLLTEDLGTFAAHYETALMQLTRSLGFLPWHIVAATATIQRFEDHVFHLYLRRARQFPGPGPTAYDSFYYTPNEDRIGRVFMGLVGIGRKHTPAVTRIATLYYEELQLARDLRHGSMDQVFRRYDMPPISADEFDRVIFNYELLLTYVLTRKGSDQVAEAIESRVRRELQEVCPQHGELILEMFNGGVDISHMLAAMDEIEEADPQAPPETRIRGLVVTNIVGHGVDVDRFNGIIFAGFTRLVAEYIQASGRVGRTFPGLSIFVATPQSERDRSIYERFGKFHEYLDRLVDPSALTRWPVAALRRTVPGILCGYLMGVAAGQVGRRLISVQEVVREFGRDGATALREEEVAQWIDAALGAALAPTDNFRQSLSNIARNSYAAIVNQTITPGQQPRYIWKVLSPMQSLRDIDEPGFIELSARDSSILRAFRRGRPVTGGEEDSQDG